MSHDMCARLPGSRGAATAPSLDARAGDARAAEFVESTLLEFESELGAEVGRGTGGEEVGGVAVVAVRVEAV